MYVCMDPVAVTYNLSSTPQQHPASTPPGHVSVAVNGLCCSGNRTRGGCRKSRSFHLTLPKFDQPLGNAEGDQVVPSFKRLTMNGISMCERTPPHTPVKNSPLEFPSSDRSSKPLPPLPSCEDLSPDEVDNEVEFFTNSEREALLQDYPRVIPFKYGVPGRRSFRGCGQINYAYFNGGLGPRIEEDCPTSNEVGQEPDPEPRQPDRPHRKLRRSHSGPAGSYNKPILRHLRSFNRASPNSDEEKPEVPPRVPIPPRPMKNDTRRWSAEVASITYGDEARPPKLPPREPLSRSNSRTPSPKSLPTYHNGVMPPTQSFAPDPNYVSTKVLHRQNSEGSVTKTPCIVPIIEDGIKVSSTHYYLLPERPPYLDKFEKYLREASETRSGSLDAKSHSWSGDSCSTLGTAKLDSKAKMDMLATQVKRKPLLNAVSP
ncbi:ERBB receptor feedback inhibitor 1a isoform X2 [Latimeria chalumnae]|nr:PREDICTED: ERBB receptor feedback inhibitor 1 isoform X2 [Latimeria chalumnae]|eukprot:XP_005994246.1 PREDICTED: ERBB receptor feedback inhibitor 1 isoform X2 [Latimeria chalumnae]